MQTSKIKLQRPNKLPQQQILEFHNLIADYSTQDLLRGKQTLNFKNLNFGFWCLNFERPKGAF